jgi:hypothetical protein
VLGNVGRALLGTRLVLLLCYVNINGLHVPINGEHPPKTTELQRVSQQYIRVQCADGFLQLPTFVAV